ncbi:hypothetical protein ABS71_08020 [bacterium SCN 62-11]|nr:hypothetical protein [Candidatus Eremiobacteraeota bacterium]ODT71920.1 MAG: hypothetical protein ABS71_08020 [bacterium SCN 62-11]
MGSLLWLVLRGRWRWLGLLGLLQAWGLPGWGMVRLLLVQLIAWRYRDAPPRRRALLAMALLLDRCHAAEWSGQDFPMALLLLLGMLVVQSNLRYYLGVMWLLQGLSDYYGPWGWARPLPHPQELGSFAWCFSGPALGLCALAGRGRAVLPLLILGLAPWPAPVASRAETRRWLGGRVVDRAPAPFTEATGECDWLLLSNNPERCRGSLGGTLLRARTPAGRGRVLLSHINLGILADLVVRARGQAEVRVVSARDGSWTDPGSRLLQQSGPWETLGELRLNGLLLNGMMQLEVRASSELDWEIQWNEGGDQLPLKEGQSRGLFLHPDRTISLGEARGVWHWQGPWLDGTLLGNYGACKTLEFQAEEAGELWLVARGGVLGSVDGQPGPLLAAGQSRCLLRYAKGLQRVKLWLPVNSFAPYSLVFREGPI